MVYTHDFELQVDGISLAGEIKFDHGEDAGFKTVGGEEMTVIQHSKVQMLFEALVNFSKCCGDISKIEISKK